MTDLERDDFFCWLGQNSKEGVDSSDVALVGRLLIDLAVVRNSRAKSQGEFTQFARSQAEKLGLSVQLLRASGGPYWIEVSSNQSCIRVPL
jgi:hypothetical protein